jgi:protein TonB
MSVLLLTLAAATQAAPPRIQVVNTLPPTATPVPPSPPPAAEPRVVSTATAPPVVQVVHPPQVRLPAQSLFSPDDYPAAAAGSGAHGRVAVMLKLDATGRVTGCSIMHTSGFPVLDAATCRNMQRRARFGPATDQNGKPIESFIAQSMEWKAG